MACLHYYLLLALCLLQASNAFGVYPRTTKTVLSRQARSSVLLRSVVEEKQDVSSSSEKVISISSKAMGHLSMMKSKQATEGQGALCLRMGVRAGGCSGMSYVMDFISEDAVTDEDHVEEYDGIKCVVDPKSLMFLFGLQLDYSDELIGGGFKFTNPNAETSCGCGKSFGV